MATTRASAYGRAPCLADGSAVLGAHQVRPADLREALALGALHLHFQPIYDLTTGRLVHHEALARWTHDRWGEVSPSVFVPLAEAFDLAAELGRWALAAASRQAAAWGAAGDPVASVAVNISAQHFAAGTVVEDVLRALDAAGLPPDRLVIELTESALITDLEGTVAQLSALRAAGLRLALDDFGTGFSSLTLMRRLPVHTVKIDRSFVEHLDSDPADAALVALVIEAAHALGLRACAEGVERPEQLLHLTAAGCDSVQGYLLGRPGPAAARPLVHHPLLPVAARTASAAEYEGLLPAVSQLVCVLTPDRRVSYVSASCLTLLGYRHDELLGRDVGQFLAPDQAARMLSEAGRPDASTRGAPDRLVQVRHRDGTYRWMRFESRLVDGDRSGRRRHLWCTAQDVTPAVEAQQALERSQRLLQAAFDLAPQPTSLADLQGRFVRVNRAFADCFGLSPERLVGRQLHEFTHPDDLADSRRELTELSAENADGYRLVKRIRHAAGHWLWVEVTVTLTRDARGEPEMAFGQLQVCQPALASAGSGRSGSARRRQP